MKSVRKSSTEPNKYAESTVISMPVREKRSTIEEKKEEANPVEGMLSENAKRYSDLCLTGTNQVTGEGMPRHTNKVCISDYFLPEQWLTDEVAGNNLYKQVAALGSIEAYVSWFNVAKAHELEGEEILDEDVAHELYWIRLSNDPYFAFAVCYFITDKFTGKSIPFILNKAQIILLELLEEMRLSGVPIRVVLLKARQWGGSTLTQLYMSWVQIFIKMEGWNSVILAQTKDTARRIKAMFTKALSEFPSDMVMGVPKLKFSPKDKSTADYIITDEGGRVIRDNTVTVASYENFEAVRGAAIAMAHYSEVAYWTSTEGKSPEGLITGISGGILNEPNTIEVLESTANGMAGYFYDEYQYAKLGKSARRALFIPWFYIRNYTKRFKSDKEREEFAASLYENRYKTMDSPTSESGEYLYWLWTIGASLEGIHWYISKRMSFHDHTSMASEFPSDDVECFKHSGRTIFDQYLLDKQRKGNSREPVYCGEITAEGGIPRLASKDADGPLRVWVHPEPKNVMDDRYLAVVDVGGRSAKADFSVITIVDRLPLCFGGKIEVVARWRGHIRYDLLAFKAVAIARFYCNAHLVFESNTFDKKEAEASEFSYDGDHTRGILSIVQDIYPNLYMRTSTSPEDIKNGKFRKIGFQTNVKTKQDMVDKFLVAFEDNTSFLDPDERVYEEMAIYEQREDGSYGNITGKDNHDDILMTDMIALMVSDEMPMPSAPNESSVEDMNLGTQNESAL